MFVIVGSLIVVLLTAALVGPHFVDWSNYREQFEAEASKVLGRQVTVEGEPSVRLLPFPSVTFSDVHVAGRLPGSTAMTARTFSMDAELAPLMSGEFRIFDMRLVAPRVFIEVDENGALDWAVRPSTPFDPRQISLEALTVTDGEMEIRHGPSGKTHRLTGLEATLAARSLAGPWRMDGRMQLDGLPVTLNVSTGALDADGGLRLHLSGGPDAYPITVNLDGTLRFDDEQPDYTGTLRLSARNAPLAKGAGGEVQPAAGPPDYRVTGAFSLSSDRLALEEARFETGPLENPYTAEGAAEITFGPQARFTVKADGAQIRFDETLAGGDGPGVTLEQRIDGLETVLSALPRPTIPGTVAVNLPAVVAGGSTIRDVQLSAQPAADGWQIESFAASLPGRTRLEANGNLRTGTDFGFSGHLLLAISQPSGFAAWLSKDVDEAIRVLPAAGFDAEVEINRTRQDFQGLELQLGEARFTGQVTRLQPDEARPSIAVELDGDALDFEALTAFSSIFVSDQGETRLSDHDLDFVIKAGPVRADGLMAETLDTALRLRDQRLEIDRLSIGGLAGANISATGSLDAIGAAPTGDVDVSILASDLAPLIAQLARRYPDWSFLTKLHERALAYPGLLADARIDLLASAADAPGRARGLAVSAQGTAGGTNLQMTASSEDLAQPLEMQPLSFSLDAANPDATALLALAGVPVLPLGLLDNGNLRLNLKGKLADELATEVALHGSDFDATFKGTVSSAQGNLRASGEANMSAADIEPWLMTSGFGMAGMGLGTSAQLNANLNLGDGSLGAQLDGTWNDEPVGGQVSLQLRDNVPHVTGTLSVSQLDLNDAASLLLGAESITSEDGEWSQAAFTSLPNLPLTTDLRLEARAFHAGQAVTVSNSNLSLKLDDGGLRISDLTGGFAGGQLSGMASLENSAGTALLSAQLVLANVDLAEVSGQEALAGKGDFGISASASGKSMDGLVAALSGSGSARLRDFSIEGLNPSALPGLISAADEIGRTVDDAAVARFAPGFLSHGIYPAGAADFAFTVVNGTARMPQTQFQTQGSTLTAEMAIDLRRETLDGRATVAFDPGDAALAGSEPVVGIDIGGTLTEPRVSYDTVGLGQFLTQRALEIEQARVEAMQAQLLEQQRLRREVRYYTALREAREEAARRKAEEETRAAERAAVEAAEAARRAQERAAPQENNPPVDAPTHFQMPLEIPEAGGIQPLTPAPGGSLPGVFEDRPGG